MRKKITLLVSTGVLFLIPGCKSQTQHVMSSDAPTLAQASAPTQVAHHEPAADTQSLQAPNSVVPPTSDAAQGFTLNMVAVEGVQIGMTRREIMEVLMPQNFEPPLCAERESEIICTTFGGGRWVDWSLSKKDETVISVKSFAPRNQLKVLLRRFTAQLGEPSIKHYEATGDTSWVWRCADGQYSLNLGLDVPHSKSAKTFLILEKEVQ